MYEIKEMKSAQIEIDKSKFIGILVPIQDEKDMDDALVNIKEMYPKANHYCYASIYGDQGTYAKMSDDGEPSRTAGAPIMEVLKHHQLTNVLCVVVRYFGGIKLGAGGLVRAYTKATTNVLDLIEIYQKEIHPIYELIFDYQMIHTVDKSLEDSIEILSKNFLDVVTYQVVCNQETIEKINEITYQLIAFKKMGDQAIYVKK